MASRSSQALRRRNRSEAEPFPQSSTSNPDASRSSHLSASSAELENPSFVLNNPETTHSSTAQTQEPPISSIPAADEVPEVPRCWICQEDATADTPETSIWRRPCPCSLTAHDECLMEWITSQEAPRPGEMATARKIVCPVCQAPIKVERPRDFLVMLADMIQKTAKTLVVPAALSALIGCFYSGFLVYGLNAMQLVFGPDEARRLLMPSPYELRAQAIAESSRFYRILSSFVKISDPFLPTMSGMKYLLGVPLIAPSIVLARTRLADQVFAILPISYFVFNPTRRLDLTSWPPSPALTLAVLPYIRTTYNELYKHTFSELEKKWDKAVQRKPREGETAEQIAAEQQERRDDGGFFGIEVEVVEEEEAMPDIIDQPGNVVAEREEEAGDLAGGGPVAQALREQLQRQMDAERNGDAREQAIADFARREGRQPDVDALRDADDLVAELQQRREAQGGRNERARRNNNGWEIRQNVSTAQIATTVMGALFFPAISSLMGDLLKVVLPAKWVTKESSRWGVKVSGGMLKEKWGRSIIGGCLFVVLKDAITLYCKWKKAKDFGKKKVLDYVGERRQASATN